MKRYEARPDAKPPGGTQPDDPPPVRRDPVCAAVTLFLLKRSR
jgi:hypothetical protein